MHLRKLTRAANMRVYELLPRVFCFFILIFNSPVSISQVIPFEVDYAKVRLPSGYSSPATPAFKNLSTAASAGGAAVNGSQVVQLGKAAPNIPLSKAFSVANIAKSAAGAILNKTAVGAIAALSLPYAIDAVTDLYAKQIPATPTPIPDSNLGICYYGSSQSSKTLEYCLTEKLLPTYPGGQFVYQSTTNKYRFYLSNGVLTGYYWAPYSVPSCTSPSIFDSAIGLCLGSAINEPANAAQLEQDIAESLGKNPPAAPIILDDLLANDVLPESIPETTVVGDIMPEPIQGPLETALKHFFDPATGHPMVESTSKDTKFKFEKTAPNEVTVKPETTTEITTIDEVTNETTTVTNTVTNTPEPVPTEAPQTDCEKFPESIGCSTYGDTSQDSYEIPTVSPTISINPGATAARVCPVPMPIHTSRGTYYMSFDNLCVGLDMIRYILLAFSWWLAIRFVIFSAKTPY